MATENSPKLLKVSVAIIAYNQADIIAETVNSILAEPRYKNLEIIIADDCSTDNSKEVITALKKEHPDIIKLVLNEKNLGITGNSNAAFFAASGDLVAIMGGDDIFLPGKLSAQATQFVNDPDLTISYHAVEIFEDKTGRVLCLTDQTARLEKRSVYDVIKMGGISGASSMMVRRSACPSYGFDPRLPVVSDWKFAIDVAYDGKIEKLDGVWGRYRKSGFGASARTYELLDESLRVLELAQSDHPDDRMLKKACGIGAARYLAGEVYRSLSHAPERAAPLALRALRFRKTPFYLFVWVVSVLATKSKWVQKAINYTGQYATKFLK